MMTGADLVVKMLEHYQVDHVFGLPGDTSLALYEAFRRSTKITHILTRDERSSAYMADAYAKVTGRVGVCEGPSGGGALYIAPGVSEADGSRVPLVCLTTDTPLVSDGRGSLTGLDQTALFEPVTRFTARALAPGKVPETLRRAFRHATGARQGASQVTLPEDVLSGEVDEAKIIHALYSEPQHSSFPAYRGTPPAADLEAAVKLLESAARPIIFCGGGLHLSGACEELKRLVDLTSVPVVTTLNGKGSLNERHPLALGVVGGNGGKQASNASVRDADAVLVIGTRLNSTSTAGGSLFANRPRLVQIDLDSTQVGNNYPVEIGLVGDAKAVLTALASVISEQKGFGKRHVPWATNCRAAVEKDISDLEKHFEADSAPFTPHRVVRALERSLPQNGILVCDAGTPTPYVAAYYRPALAGRVFVAGRAHGSLGYAIPAAVGAKIGAPDRPVLALFGDGSFAMSCGTLETIQRYRLPIVMLSFRNGCYGWIKCLQQLYCGEAYFGVDLGTDADYCAIARGFGIRAVRPASGPELDKEINRAAAGNEPVFIDVAVECMTQRTPPVSAWEHDAALPAGQRRRTSY